MGSLNAKTALALLVMVGIMLGVGPVRAHEGHDHGAPPPVSADIAPRAEAVSPEFELVAVARGGELVIHLDEFRTNSPVSGADLQIDTPSGQLNPADQGGGVYTVAAPFLTKPGAHDLAITVSAKGTVDILAATLTIPEPAQAADALAHEHSWLVDSALAQELRHHVGETGVSTWLILAAGFAAGMFVARLIWRHRAAASVAVALLAGAQFLPAMPAVADPAVADPAVADSAIPAPPDSHEHDAAPPVSRDVAQRLPDGTVFVPKPTQRILGMRTVMTEAGEHHRAVELPGRIIPSPNASGLVQASVGGRLSPPEGGFKPLGTSVKAGDVLAYVHPPLALADVTEQQQWSRELDQQISIVERKVERFRKIQNVIAKSQLEDAELELAGLRKRRASLDRVHRDPEELVAPVDGVIASANAVAGQMAEPNAVIYQIVDPVVLWIEALSYKAHGINGTANARLSDGRTVALDYVGTGLAGSNQAVPIHFAIAGDVTGLRAGQFVTVVAEAPDERRGIALPRAAVVRGGNGQSLVYEHINAERFVAIEVRVEPLDGARVLVVAGIEPGMRIVTQGAELLSQIR